MTTKIQNLGAFVDAPCSQNRPNAQILTQLKDVSASVLKTPSTFSYCSVVVRID